MTAATSTEQRSGSVDALVELVAGGNVVVLSGAGLSTDSGIPDYRGATGSLRRHTPMTYQTFTRDPRGRHRYWARSYVGWRQIRGARPNDGHRAVGEATWRVTRRRGRWGRRVVWTPLCGLPLVAKRALWLASEQAQALGHDQVRPEHLLLGVLDDARRPADMGRGSRRHRQITAHVGLPDGYQGAAGLLLAALGVDLDQLRAAIAIEVGGVQR